MVTEELTRITGFNFVIDPSIRDKVVNAYFLNRPHEQVLEMFAASNELILIPEGDYYSLRKGTPAVAQTPSNLPNNGKERPGNYKSGHENGDFILEKNQVGTLDVFARNVRSEERRVGK